MYQQGDGVTTRSPLGQALTNIFVSFQEKRLFTVDSIYMLEFILSKTLVHRALIICLKSKLHTELEKHKMTFLNNGYPEDVILSYTKEKFPFFWPFKSLAHKRTLCNDDMLQIIEWLFFHLAVLESIYIQTKNPLLCRQKEFVFSLGLQLQIFFVAGSTDWTTIPVLCLRFSDWPISIHDWVSIFHHVLLDPNSEVICSEKCHMKKLYT